MRRLIPILALALLAARMTAPVAAQEPSRIRFIVRDSTATPQPGITVMLDVGDGRGALPRVTDATGATAPMRSPTSLVTVTQVLDRDTTPLTFEMTTLTGLLVIPLAGDLDVPWAYDRASRSVISLPRTMSNEAFPELEVLPGAGDDQLVLPGTPTPAGEAATLLVPGEPARAASTSMLFWLLVVGLILGGVGLGLFVWAQARAGQRRPPVVRRPRGDRQ